LRKFPNPALELNDEVRERRAENVTNLAEFDNVDATLSALHLTHKGLLPT
jgi:hypothetical protein